MRDELVDLISQLVARHGTMLVFSSYDVRLS